MVTLYWESDFKAADVIEVHGNFTNPPWTVGHRMVYSSFFRAYSATVCMIVNSHFKFLVNGKYMISNKYAKTFVCSFEL